VFTTATKFFFRLTRLVSLRTRSSSDFRFLCERVTSCAQLCIRRRKHKGRFDGPQREESGISDEMTLSSIERFVFLSFEALKVKGIETQT